MHRPRETGICVPTTNGRFEAYPPCPPLKKSTGFAASHAGIIWRRLTENVCIPERPFFSRRQSPHPSRLRDVKDSCPSDEGRSPAIAVNLRPPRPAGYLGGQASNVG